MAATKDEQGKDKAPATDPQGTAPAAEGDVAAQMRAELDAVRAELAALREAQAQAVPGMVELVGGPAEPPPSVITTTAVAKNGTITAIVASS